MAAPDLNALFEGYYQARTLVRPLAAYTSLVAHPRTFLRKYATAVNEMMAQPAGGVLASYFYTSGAAGDARRPGTVLRGLRKHLSETFKFNLLNPPAGMPMNSYIVTQAYYVPMLHATAATVFNTIAWVRLGTAATVMITVRLSGCSFLWRTNNGALEVAHLQPHGGLDGSALQTQLEGNGAEIYGRTSYGPGRVVSIVGVRSAAGWKIYAQKFRVGTNEIMSVHRLYPGE